jgi:hypothetical protein
MKNRTISEETKAKNRQRDRERYHKNKEVRLKKIEASKARQNKAKEKSDAEAAAKLEAKRNKANGSNNTEMASRLEKMISKERAEKIEKQIALENQKIETKEKDNAKRRERYATDPEYRRKKIDNSATVKNAKRKKNMKAVKAERAESRSEENALIDLLSEDTNKRAKPDLAEQVAAPIVNAMNEFDIGNLLIENAEQIYLPEDDKFPDINSLLEPWNNLETSSVGTHQQNLWNSRMQNKQATVTQEPEAPQYPQNHPLS